jgi:hypothetical protein
MFTVFVIDSVRTLPGEVTHGHRSRVPTEPGSFPELSRKGVLRRLLKSDPQEADAMLERLKIQTKDAVSDVRRLVYGLGPRPSTTWGSSA